MDHLHDTRYLHNPQRLQGRRIKSSYYGNGRMPLVPCSITWVERGISYVEQEARPSTMLCFMLRAKLCLHRQTVAILAYVGKKVPQIAITCKYTVGQCS